MKIRPTLIALAIGFVVLAPPIASAQDRFSLNIEVGPAWQLRNDFAVPGDSGTLVRLDDKGPALAGRATLVWQATDRWSLRFLAAPLSTTSDFVPTEDVVFQRATFAKGQGVSVDYRFDSYRVGAFYRFPASGPWSLRAGATLKVRDAEISLKNATQTAKKSNTGVVPLLYGGVRLQASERVALDLDVDAAAASQGRAVDMALRVEAKVTGHATLFVGGRVLEGGADNDEVYTFATFAYAFAGINFRW